MNKYILTILLTLSFQNTNGDDFKWGEEFKEGDTISAEVFNQIFSTIEKINRTVVDSDLVGTWNCDATTTRETTGYTNKGSFYLLEDAQINFNSSGASTSLETPYNISTSSPGPLKRENSAFSGTYQLYKNMLFLKQSGDNNARIYSVDVVSNSRIELTFLETSAISFPALYSSFVVCDSAANLSNPPSDMTISQSGSSITIGWTDNSSDETGFKINRRTSSDTSYTLLTTTDANVTFYTDSNVTEGTTYFYTTSAVNSNGDSNFSNPVSITADSTPPTVVSSSPAENSTANIDDRSLTINYSENIKYTMSDGSQAIKVVATYNKNQGSFTEYTTFYGFPYVFNVPGTLASTITIVTPSTSECLKPGTDVTVTVFAAGIVDDNGVGMASDHTFKYTVGNQANDSSSFGGCGLSAP